MSASLIHELGKVLGTTLSEFSSENPHSPRYLSLAAAEIVSVNPEELSVLLRIKNADEGVVVESPLTFSSIGRRHFFGAMPQVGDICVVGFTIEGIKNKKAIILNWMPAGTLYAQDWLTTSSFSKKEFDLNSPEEKVRLEGAYNFIRHKMRSLSEGDIVLSSSKGADVLLDEDLILNNRAANEINLRSSDQTIVFRALREHHALGGTKIISGVVQRDAQLLPTQMTSDGLDWARYDLFNTEGGIVEPPTTLNEKIKGTLTPHPIFDFSQEQFFISNEIRPNVFLNKTPLLQGDFTNVRTPYRVYGGKYFHRVQNQERNLTEYRIELAHSTDETLPVDDGTEGFDTESLTQSTAPFVEFVLGTAIGNDPFTSKGSKQYGKPLTALISSKGGVQPTITPSNFVGEHLAYLLRINPLKNGNPSDSNSFFSAVTKNGRALLNVVGEGAGAVRPSAEVNLSSGLNLFAGANSLGKSLVFNTTGIVEFNIGEDAGGNGFRINTAGGLRFESQGEMLSGGAGDDPTATQSAQDMSNSIEFVGRKNIGISSGRELRINAESGVFVKNTDKMEMTLNSRFSLETDNVDIQATEMNQSITTRATYTYSGPKNSLPTNFPLRETKINSIIPTKAKVDVTEILVGEKLTKVKTTGAVRTQVTTGTIEHKVNVGQVILSSGGTNMTLSPLSLIAKSTFVSIQATGSLAMSGSTSVSLSTSGLASISGSAITLATTTTTFAGGILTSGTINPMTGTPFATSLCFGNPSTNIV